MNPDVLYRQAARLVASRLRRFRTFGWALADLAHEVELGLWPRHDAVTQCYPVPGTARFYIVREIEKERAA